MTCKKKRLKCDETKPTCTQCEKRNVECEGYKKDYKWRSFEETNKHSKVGKSKKTVDTSTNHKHSVGVLHGGPCPIEQLPFREGQETPWLPSLQYAFNSATHAITTPAPSSHVAASTSHNQRFSSSQFDPLPILNPGFSPSELDLPLPYTHVANQLPRREDGSGQSSISGGSPNLADLLLPGTNMGQPPDPSEQRPPMSPLPYQPGLADSALPPGIAIQQDEDFDEEIVREPFITDLPEQQWKYQASSPAVSDASSSSSGSTDASMLRAPPLDPSSPEMLMLRFDKETCGILSIKDGPFENPWRNLIWPLAKDSQALFHAISSMAALHGSLRNPQLRIAGMQHMNKSLHKLSSELHNMRLDQALATSLALALGEGWDDKISTGIQHLKGAKTLLNNALVQRTRNIQFGQLDEEGAKRLKFLCNTYVYLDVIARLTSAEAEDSINLDDVLQIVNEPFSSGISVEVDPLMGCATTLFPLIGKVATLVQDIRRTKSNSLNVVSEANELREQLLQWQAPVMELIEQPQDPSSNVRHAISTAEAYRRATVLHLHQAVPELISESIHAQAKNILTILAGTPLSSRTLIIQIFPLLVGSCEMVLSDDRRWVCQRWEAMMQRLSIVNVESCWKLVREVWQRRDARIQEQARRLTSRVLGKNVSPGLFIPPTLKRKMPSADAISSDAFFGMSQDGVQGRDHVEPPLKRRLTYDVSFASRSSIFAGGPGLELHRRQTDVTMSNIEPEFTVRGRLHWLTVMADWNWEGKSLPCRSWRSVALDMC